MKNILLRLLCRQLTQKLYINLKVYEMLTTVIIGNGIRVVKNITNNCKYNV